MTDGLLNEQARGVFVIVATPFDETGNLDLASTDSLIDFYLGCGVHGMTILGVMGEAPKLSAEESARFAGRVVLMHSDIGTGDDARNARIAAWLGPQILPYLAPGAIVASDQPLAALVDMATPPPEGVEMLGRWHSIEGGRGMCIARSDDAEFPILLPDPGPTPEERITTLARTVAEELGRHTGKDGARPGLAFGFAIHPEDGADREALVARTRSPRIRMV